ncbi:MAG TPA: hypothetical protein VF128_11035 [Gemmatimonadaceae bacterium]
MSDATERLAVALADRYRLHRELGEGGMATVYLADDLKHRRKVAIKVPRSGGEPRLLVHFPDPTRPSYRPTFTTDEKRIYFTIEDRQSDVHVAEVVKK